MRRFRFIGDPGGYKWSVKPVKCEVYDWVRFRDSHGNLNEWDKIEIFDTLDKESDWQEVFDEPKPLHKDTDLGYFAGLAMKGQFTQVDKYLEAYGDGWVNPFIENSITLAKELIKQLDKESPNNLPTNHNE